MHEWNSDLHEKNTLRFLILHKRVHVYEIFVWGFEMQKKKIILLINLMDTSFKVHHGKESPNVKCSVVRVITVLL